jgi:hypothetical protein
MYKLKNWIKGLDEIYIFDITIITYSKTEVKGTAFTVPNIYSVTLPISILKQNT